jgi:glycosyltransferase involved in cell wall biosynthesis
VVTLTYNRRKFIDLAFHNLMWSDYPLDKIEWIVVDDSDNEHAISDKLMDFCAKVPALHLEYVPLAARTSIAEKRNIGCARASNDIIVVMDDDDHYPTTSFRRRVSWLLSGDKAAVGCSMIAMYDLVRGASAVNVPPWNIPLAQRLSEATLAFRKSFWEARPFSGDIAESPQRPEGRLAEGEAWIAGREAQFLEIPPQQIIVALSHNNNVSSRRVPADAKPSCFWGFSPEMLKFLHGLAGMQVEFNDLKEPAPKGKGKAKAKAQ